MKLLTPAQYFCGAFHGHEDLMKTGEGRIWLQCLHCHRETAGWCQARVPIRPTRPLTRAEAQQVRQELQEIEMALGGGG